MVADNLRCSCCCARRAAATAERGKQLSVGVFVGIPDAAYRGPPDVPAGFKASPP